MGLPTGIDQVTVDIGRYTSQNGDTSYSGKITFTPSGDRFYIPTGTPLPADPIVVDVTDGAGLVTLVASDARDCAINGEIQYTVDYSIKAPSGQLLQLPRKILYLSRLVPLVDLEQTIPVDPAAPTGISTSFVSGVAGLSGSILAADLAARLAPYLPSGGGGTGTSGPPAGGWPLASLNASVQSLLGLAHDSVQIGGDLSGIPTSPQIRAGVVGLPELATGLALPKAQLASDVQASLGRADTSLQPGDVFGSGSVGPADATTLGVIKLTGDLGGTANSPTVPGLAGKLDATDPSVTNARAPLDHNHDGTDIVSGTVSAARLGSGAAAGRVLTAIDGTSASWQVAAGGGDGLASTLKLSGPGPHTYDDDTWHAKVVEIDSSGPAQVVLPPGQSGGTYAHVIPVGTGLVAFEAGTGAFLDPPSGAATPPATRARNGQVTVRRRADPSGTTFPTGGLLARFKAADLGAVGGSVSTWPDSSGVGTQSLLQATSGMQPKVSSIGGFKTVHFDGIDDWLQMTGTLLNLARNRSTLVMYCLCEYATNGTPVAGKRSLISLSTGTGTSARAFMQKETDSTLVAGGRRLDTDAASQSGRGGTIPVATPFLLVGRLQWAANQATVLLNGTAETATGFSNPNTAWLTGSTANTSNTASQVGAVGANTAGTAEYWFGDIFELGFFSADVDRAALDTALQNAYGFPATSDYIGSGDRWAFSGDLA